MHAFRSLVAASLLLAIPALAQQNGAPHWTATLDSAMAAELARTGTPGAQVAVVVNGKVAYSKGFGVADIETGRTVTAQTLFRVGSVTKMITAAALAQMSVNGAIDLQAPIGKYVPEISGKRVANVTTHQLLTHSAGWIDNAIPYGRMGEGALGEVFREVNDSLFFTEPGRVISYSNPGYSMAGYVTEQAGGGRFGDIVDRLVLRKMGMPRATFRPLVALTHDFSHGHMGAPGNAPPRIVRPFTENTAQWAAGFLMASAEELSRFTIALMDGGKLEGEQVLAPEAVLRMTTGYMDMPGNPDSKYAYGLMVGTSRGERVWQHGGSINGFDALVVMVPDKQVSVVLIDNRSGSPLTGIIDIVTKEAAGMPPAERPATPTEVETDAADRAQLVGRYAQGGLRLEVAEQAGKLVIRQGGGTIPATMLSDGRLRAKLPNGSTQEFALVRGAGGRVEYLHRGLRSVARQP
jgi:CubicO group peptidase (beta-lactamase class C family)